MPLNTQLIIASPPDREKLVVEIHFNDIQWCEINQEKDFFEVEFHPRPDNKPWVISFEQAINALEDAKKRLLS